MAEAATERMSTKEALADVCIGILATVPTTLLRAFVLLKLWFWFAVPLGLRMISMGEALGLSLLLFVMTYRHSKPAYDSWSGTRGAVTSVVLSLIAWGVGAIYAHYR